MANVRIVDQQGQTYELPEDKAQEALATGDYRREGDAEEAVYVKNIETQEEYRLPKSKAQEALATGDYEEVEAGLLEKVSAGASGFVKGLTGGLSGFGEAPQGIELPMAPTAVDEQGRVTERVPKDPEMTQEYLAEKHPGYTLAGELGGFVAGGIGNLAGRGAANLAAKTGLAEVAGKGIAKGVEAATKKVISPAKAAAAVVGLTGAAVEGAVIGAADPIHKMGQGKNVSAEDVGNAALSGAAWGLGIAAGVGVIGATAGKIRKGLLKKGRITEEQIQTLWRRHKDVKTNVSSFERNVLPALDDEAQTLYTRIKEKMLQKNEDLLTILKKAEPWADNLKAYNNKLRDLKISPPKSETFSFRSSVKRLQTRKAELLEKMAAAQRGGAIVDEFGNAIPNTERIAEAQRKINLINERITKLRDTYVEVPQVVEINNTIDEIRMFTQKMMVNQKSISAQKNHINNMYLREALTNQISDVYKRVYNVMSVGGLNVGILSPILSGGAAYAYTQDPKTAIMAAFGGVLIRKMGSELLLGGKPWLKIKVGDDLLDSVGNYAKSIKYTGIKMLTEKEYESAKETVNSMDPNIISEAIKEGAGVHNEEMAKNMTKYRSAEAMFLRDAVRKNRVSFSKALDAVANPQHILARANNLSLTMEDIEYLVRTNPEIYQELRAMAEDILQNNKYVPSSKRRVLEMILYGKTRIKTRAQVLAQMSMQAQQQQSGELKMPSTYTMAQRIASEGGKLGT